MLNNSQINLHYEEWNIKLDAGPGWKLVLAFVRILIEMQFPFSGWIFEWDPNVSYYVKAQRFDHENKNELLSSLGEAMSKDALAFIKILRNAPFYHLLENYSKVSEGTIIDNQQSAVFPAPVEIDEWTRIGEEELVLVIHHDGEPLFFLRKE